MDKLGNREGFVGRMKATTLSLLLSSSPTEGVLAVKMSLLDCPASGGFFASRGHDGRDAVMAREKRKEKSR